MDALALGRDAHRRTVLVAHHQRVGLAVTVGVLEGELSGPMEGEVALPEQLPVVGEHLQVEVAQRHRDLGLAVGVDVPGPEVEHPAGLLAEAAGPGSAAHRVGLQELSVGRQHVDVGVPRAEQHLDARLGQQVGASHVRRGATGIEPPELLALGGQTVQGGAAAHQEPGPRAEVEGLEAVDLCSGLEGRPNCRGGLGRRGEGGSACRGRRARQQSLQSLPHGRDGLSHRDRLHARLHGDRALLAADGQT